MFHKMACKQMAQAELIKQPRLLTHTADQNPFNVEEQAPIELLTTFEKQTLNLYSLRKQ